jgi:SAM-dependent methyltransferase
VMREYWEERARLNAAFYVDTSMDFDAPDMERFLATGQRIVEIALDEAPVKPERHEVALEIGCGLGRICLALSSRFERVIGYDISAEMLAQARELVPDERVDLRLTDGTSLPDTPDGSVDLVVSFTVFQHIPSVPVIEGYIHEAGRVLRPGGVFAFQWNNQRGERLWPLQRAVRSARQRLGRGDVHGRDATAFLGSRVSLPTIDRALTHAGLERCGLDNEGRLFAWAWARKPA